MKAQTELNHRKWKLKAKSNCETIQELTYIWEKFRHPQGLEESLS